MSRLFALLTLSGLLAACAPSSYQPFGEPKQPLATALRECQDKARAANPSKTTIPELKIAVARQEAIDACMEGKGYRASQS